MSSSPKIRAQCMEWAICMHATSDPDAQRVLATAQLFEDWILTGNASADTRRMAETGTGSVRSTGGAVPNGDSGDAQ